MGKIKLGVKGVLYVASILTVVWILAQSLLLTANSLEQKNDAVSTASATSTSRILFVHVGKTGGEWIRSQLAVICKTRKNPHVKKSCLEKFEKEVPMRTQLSQRVFGYFHVHSIFPRNAHAAASHYLFSVRHPLSRLVSWYVYNHPKSCDPRESNSPSCKHSDWKTSFFDCFPTLEALGRPLLPNAQGDKACANVLSDGWLGRVPNVKEPNHLYWNYNFYWNATQSSAPRKRILVVRQESLIEDINNLERMLGGIPPEKWHPADSKHHISGRVGTTLSDQATQTLCCYLKSELQIYHTIITRADNLSEDAKSKSLTKVYQDCGLTRSLGEWNCSGTLIV